MELQEIEEMFPTNVQEDFGEFMANDTLEKIDKMKSFKNFELISDEDYAFLAKTFITMMDKYSK